MTINIALNIAAILAVTLGIAHSYLGERYILTRLFRVQGLPKLFGDTKFTTRTLRFTWHITTIAWWGFAAIFLQLAHGRVSTSSISAAQRNLNMAMNSYAADKPCWTEPPPGKSERPA